MSYPNPFDEDELLGDGTLADETQSCPVGLISIEQFDTGMDEVKRMYALVVTENKALLAVATTGKALKLRYEPKLKMWILMGEEAECKAFDQALAALPENLR
jgi:hypothetical protein